MKILKTTILALLIVAMTTLAWGAPVTVTPVPGISRNTTRADNSANQTGDVLIKGTTRWEVTPGGSTFAPAGTPINPTAVEVGLVHADNAGSFQTLINKAVSSSYDAVSTPFLIADSKTTLTIKANTYIKVINAGVHTIINFDADTAVTVATALDTGAIAAGLDYYVYVCADGAVKISLAATYPAGYTAANSKQIGGFHTLCVSAGTISGHTLTGFVATDILPASVWCLNFRAICSNKGMVYSDLAKGWVDIYLPSGTGASTLSVYGGTISHNRAWFDTVADFAAVGKELLNDANFYLIAIGSNSLTNISTTADPVTAGGHSDTAARRMISNIGAEDACGAYWCWLSETGYHYSMGAAPDHLAMTQTATIYHAAAPGGNPIYVKYTDAGIPYLCCNMASAAVNKLITLGSYTYKIAIKHDADAATGGLPLYFIYNGTIQLRLVVNNTSYGKNTFIPASDPTYMLTLVHDASAATNGRAVNYDDGADDRMEYISPGSANATIDLTSTNPAFGNPTDAGNGEGVYKFSQGLDGYQKCIAGGAWTYGASCGPRTRGFIHSAWTAGSNISSRGFCKSR